MTTNFTDEEQNQDQQINPADATASQGFREGSSLYYALLYASPDSTQSIFAALKLSKTLADTLIDVNEPSVAQKKIHWWHEEISRLFDGEPRHPATSGIINDVTEFNLDPDLFMSILEANNSEKFNNSDTNSSFHLRLEKDFGARLKLCLSILRMDGQNQDSEPDWLKPLSLGLGTFDRLAQFRKLHHRGYPVFPASDYTRLNSAPEQVTLAHQHSQTEQLLNFRVQDAYEHLEQALSFTELTSGTDTLPFHTIADLRLKQLTTWQRKKHQPTTSYLALTPVRKAWISWRCKVQH